MVANHVIHIALTLDEECPGVGILLLVGKLLVAEQDLALFHKVYHLLIKVEIPFVVGVEEERLVLCVFRLLLSILYHLCHKLYVGDVGMGVVFLHVTAHCECFPRLHGEFPKVVE